MRKIPKCRDIIRLISVGYSDNKIAGMIGADSRTVNKIRSVIKEKNMEWPLDIHLDDQYIYYSLFPLKDHKRNKQKPDVDAAYDGVMSGKTKRVMYYEYKEQCEKDGVQSVMYDRFIKCVREKEDENRAATDKNVKAGKRAYVLWLKEPITYTDLDGVAYKGKVFLGVLPYSHYAYAGLYQKDTKETWVDAHVKLFRCFGGAPQELVAEKSKSTSFHGELQIGYRELVEHYSSYITLNEENKYPEEIEEIISWFTEEIGNQIFPSYEEAAAHVKAVLNRYWEECPYGTKNRTEMFKDGEQKSLIKHPEEEYVPVVRKDAKIMFNCHVKYEGNYYSVPFQFAMLEDKKVQLEISKKYVKIYYEGRLISEHPHIQKNKGVYQTHLKDMPSAEEAKLMEWHPDRFLSWARAFGPNTKNVIRQVLGSKDIVQRTYIHCRTILLLGDTYGYREVEKACKEILELRKSIVYNNIENIIKRNLSAGIK